MHYDAGLAVRYCGANTKSSKHGADIRGVGVLMVRSLTRQNVNTALLFFFHSEVRWCSSVQHGDRVTLENGAT